MEILDIHKRLKEARSYLNLNQLNIAKDLNIHQKTVSEIENGKIINIPNTYILYFHKKGISLNWIYTGGNEMFDEEKNPELHLNFDKKQEVNPISQSKIENNDIESVLFQNIAKPEPLLEKLSPEMQLLIKSKNNTILSLLAHIRSQYNMINTLKSR